MRYLKIISSIAFYAVLFPSLLLSLGSCAAKRLGPPVFYPSSKEAPGYSKKDQAWLYESDRLNVSVRQVGPEPEKTGDEKAEEEEYYTVIDELFDNGYTLLRLEITNKGEDKVFYNPFLTALHDNDLGYTKPMDYTDLYEYVEEHKAKDEITEELLSDIKDRYYDGTVTVQPGEKVARLLIFKPLSKDATKADLKIKDIYTTKSTTDVVLPFELNRPEKK